MTEAIVLLGLFFGLMLAGVPIAFSLGLSGTAVVVLMGADMPWWGLYTLQQSFDASIAKYPLLALPMFVLVGCAFDRSGVASRMVTFAMAVLGRGPGMLPIAAILVAMVLGGISGSGAALAGAIGAVMLGAMRSAGYPPAFSATVIGSATATDILIPPSLAFVIYSVMVPGVSLPALFAAGLIPGVLAGLALILPAWLISRHRQFGAVEAKLPRPPFWKSLREASWGLVTPVLILGGMRAGLFTPTEAAVVAAVWVLFIGIFIHRTIGLADLYDIFAESAKISAVILIIVGFTGVFGYCINTLGVADPVVAWLSSLGLGPIGALVLTLILIKVISIFLEGVTVFMVFLPLLTPLVKHFGWDPVWFAVLLTMVMALGQFTPPLAVNLLVACRIAQVPIESTFRWVGWFFLSFVAAIAAVIFWPQLALWLPRISGF
ncbi:MAG TPA: C4-dicarboxylate ABC transporter [Comamonadaceae bacterium]|uniref:TRAP transporter large permease n=1 Tax=Acidovorax sp. 210-6 TaxID=2699468 RepID=UPI000AB92522|nr:TRAP transporter large permease [Acidovorax sp. 210-6]MCL4768822.1 TRAP transporter large permease [Burkholderiaceae bacterium]NCU66874.1 TRAP transporter large permease [Acidovorax sp. 210-6]HCE29584.1 C4-dicarboxylate ABC transporter [Comamonadaceae bacterium]